MWEKLKGKLGDYVTAAAGTAVGTIVAASTGPSDDADVPPDYD